METSRPAKLDVRSLTKANLDASGVADASPLSARSKLRRFASTSDLPPAIQPPRMKKRHSIAVSADDDYADYHAHNLRHVDALHGDLLYLPADATAAKVVYSHETLALMCILCIVAGVGAVAPAALIVDQEPSAMQLVMLGNYLYERSKSGRRWRRGCGFTSSRTWRATSYVPRPARASSPRRASC